MLIMWIGLICLFVGCVSLSMRVNNLESNLRDEQSSRYSLEMDFYAFQIYLGYGFEKQSVETRLFRILSKNERKKLVKDFTIVTYDYPTK